MRQIPILWLLHLAQGAVSASLAPPSDSLRQTAGINSPEEQSRSPPSSHGTRKLARSFGPFSLSPIANPIPFLVISGGLVIAGAASSGAKQAENRKGQQQQHGQLTKATSAVQSPTATFKVWQSPKHTQSPEGSVPWWSQRPQSSQQLQPSQQPQPSLAPQSPSEDKGAAWTWGPGSSPQQDASSSRNDQAAASKPDSGPSSSPQKESTNGAANGQAATTKPNSSPEETGPRAYLKCEGNSITGKCPKDDLCVGDPRSRGLTLDSICVPTVMDCGGNGNRICPSEMICVSDPRDTACKPWLGDYGCKGLCV